MADLQVWILTHPASSWDVEVLKNDCLVAFAGQGLSVEVRFQSNANPGGDALPAFRYIGAAIAAQWQIGNARLAKRFSVLTLLWHLRQMAGLGATFLGLISRKRRDKVASEASRAARIATGHVRMWQEAAGDKSGLYLFLEDDVTLTNPKMLVGVTRSLLEITKTESLLVCDASHSFSLSDIGIDPRLSPSQSLANLHLVAFDFPFTNTLAATFMSQGLLEHLLKHSLSAGGLNGLGVDLDLCRLLTRMNPRPTGFMSRQRVFRQMSEFTSQRF